ncbi:MAG: ABC-2 family transporter protein [Armatimonadetes bacterium]|nr:ABC-2 family transporter protein [Armatimonadota bacterium]
MRWFVRIYRAFFRMALAMMIQYRAAMLIWAVWGFVGPMVSLAVWIAAAQGGKIGGFDRGDFAAYFLALTIINHIAMSWDAESFSWDIRSGNLSPQLLRPVHPIHAALAYNIGYKLLTVSVLLPIWAALFWLLRPTFHSSWHNLAWAVPAILAGAALRFLWNYCLAIIAFWTTRTQAINQLYWTVDSFLSGRIAPIALLPGALQLMAYYSPFRSMIAFPVELTLGRVPPQAILPGIAAQFLWMIAAWVLFRVLWSQGVKQYSAVGA